MAANSGAIRAGKAFVELFADDTKLAKGLRAAQSKLKAWGAQITSMGTKLLAAGTAMKAPFAAALAIFAETGSALADMSTRTGISVEALSELEYAVGQSGAEMEDLETSSKHLSKNIAEAAGGSKEAKGKFDSLGVSLESLKNQSPEEQFYATADAIATIQNPTARAAAAMDVFGKSGTKMLPLLENGAAGIDELRKQARDLGLTISGSEAAAAKEYADSIAAIWLQAKRAAFAVGSALLPTLKDAVAWVKRILKGTIDWIKQNGDLIRTASTVASVVMAVGAGLIVLGGIFTAGASAIGVVLGVLSAVGAVLGFIMSPVGLLIGGLAALTYWFATSTESGQAAVTYLQEAFAGLAADAKEAFGGIADALAGGNIALAGKILWLELKLQWEKGKAALLQIWADLKTGMAIMLIDGLAAVETAWVSTVTFLGDFWDRFLQGFMDAWNTVQNWLSKRFIDLMGLFDSTLDTGAAKGILDDELAKKKSARQTAADKSVGDRNADAGKQKAAIEADRQQTVSNALDGGDKIDRTAIDDARNQMKDLLEAAKKAKAGGNSETPGKSKAEVPNDFAQKIKDKISASGTFSARAAGQIGDGSAANRTAKATEETAKHVKKMAANPLTHT